MLPILPVVKGSTSATIRHGYTARYGIYTLALPSFLKPCPKKVGNISG